MTVYQTFLFVSIVTVPLSLAAAEKCNTLTRSVADGLAVTNGTEVTFTCTVYDGGIAPVTRWIVPSVDGCAPREGTEITLQPAQGFNSSCGPFSAASTTSEGNCYTSILTVSESAELAGKLIRCQNRSYTDLGCAEIPPGEINRNHY